MTSPSSRYTNSTDFTILRGIGVTMFILSILDLVLILVPPELFNPTWEFQSAGTVMERIPVPMLSIGLIFLGKNNLRKSWEKLALHYLSWGSLVAGILIIILVPIILITSYARISDQLDVQYSNELRARTSQSSEIREQIAQAEPNEIVNFLQQQSQRPVEITPEEAKEQLIQSLGDANKQTKAALVREKNQRLTKMRKNALKWTTTSVFSGILLISIWHWSVWAR